ncbi:MAG: ABC transporter substrate-binding protein [Actinomycetota bacterium]
MITRLAPLLVVASLIAGACGDDGEIGAEDFTLATTTTVADAPPATATTAPLAEEPLDEEERAASFPRTIEHELGSTEIPAQPERVVAVTGVADIDALLAIGVVPVGAGAYFPVSYAADFGFAPWNEEYWGVIPGFLIRPEINLEELVQLEPDLIVGQPAAFGAAYDQFSAIAPTVVYSVPSDWRHPIELFGEALGREVEAAAAIAALEAELEAAAERVPDDAPTLAIVSPTTENITIYTPDLGAGPAQTLEEIGFPIVDVDGPLSYERIADLADADYVVVFDFTIGPVDELLEDPLFVQLPAVQAGNVLRLTPEESFSWVFETARSIPLVIEGLLDALGM